MRISNFAFSSSITIMGDALVFASRGDFEGTCIGVQFKLGYLAGTLKLCIKSIASL